MPNKYYLREDRKAVKPEMEEPTSTSFYYLNDNHLVTSGVCFNHDGWNEAANKWLDHLLSLPALDVDPDYLKRLSPGWFEGEEQYEVSAVKDKWRKCSKAEYDKQSPALWYRVTIIAPQEAEKRIGADNICPETKELCLDECCSPGSVCNVSGSKLQPADKGQEGEVTMQRPWEAAIDYCNQNHVQTPKNVFKRCFSSFIAGVNWKHENEFATPQPVTGEAGDDEAAFNEWESSIPKPMMEVLDELAGHTYPVRGILRRLFRQAASRPTDAVEFGDLIEDAVNAYFHQAEKELGRKDLGYIEERNWQKIKNDCQRFFANSKSPNPNK